MLTSPTLLPVGPKRRVNFRCLEEHGSVRLRLALEAPAHTVGCCFKKRHLLDNLVQSLLELPQEPLFVLPLCLLFWFLYLVSLLFPPIFFFLVMSLTTSSITASFTM